MDIYITIDSNYLLYVSKGKSVFIKEPGYPRLFSTSQPPQNSAIFMLQRLFHLSEAKYPTTANMEVHSVTDSTCHEVSQAKDMFEGTIPEQWDNILAGFPSHTVRAMNRITFCTPEAAFETTRKLWSESTTTHPLLFPSKGCWTVPHPPHISQLIISTLDLIQEKKLDSTIKCSVFRRGELDSDLDPRVVIAQLCDPDPSDPAAIIGYKLDILPEGALSAPNALKQYAEPYLEDEQQVLMTPKYWISDIHIGKFIMLHFHCLDGLRT